MRSLCKFVSNSCAERLLVTCNSGIAIAMFTPVVLPVRELSQGSDEASVTGMVFRFRYIIVECLE